jgi:hypothetical protein
MPDHKNFMGRHTENPPSPRLTRVFCVTAFIHTREACGDGLLIFGRHAQIDSSNAAFEEAFQGAEHGGYLKTERNLRNGIYSMQKVKDTLRSTVNLTFDGRVIKAYHGPNAHARFGNEVRVLRHLQARGCGFAPRLLEADEKKLRIITTNCGSRVEHLDAERAKELFAELEKFGVRHDDPDMRNVTYRQSDGRFCLIDFEFATILPENKSSPSSSSFS